MPNRMQNKVALVTGAGSGIGRATALLFAREGGRVAAVEIDPQAGEETARQIQSEGGVGMFAAADMTRADQVEASVRACVERYGRLDVIVNVAGGSGRRWGDGPGAECTVEGWDRTMELNLKSTFLGCKYALQAMLSQGEGGAIVNTSSVLGLVGGDEDFNTVAYAASKGGIVSLTRTIASYYASKHIRANAIAPGLTATNMSRRAQESESVRARLPELQPLTSDFGRPEDIAQAALYLASDESSFVTGTVLVVDGGWTMR